MLAQLKLLIDELTALKGSVSKEPGPRISKKIIRQRADSIATQWFTDISPEISKQITPETLEHYNIGFNRLLKLSGSNNRKDSYIETLSGIFKNFRSELILPIQTTPRLSKQVTALDTMLTDFSSVEEDEYFKEATKCANANLLRASAVMGWCACIDRIHKKIEELGYDKFNSTSQAMATQNSGRFKRFSSAQRVTSMSELREVFDSNILWILEGMKLIDNNQHTRLRSCFELRCQSSHPGDAPMTEYNLLSFFSDINEIVFKNPKFTI